MFIKNHAVEHKKTRGVGMLDDKAITIEYAIGQLALADMDHIFLTENINVPSGSSGGFATIFRVPWTGTVSGVGLAGNRPTSAGDHTRTVRIETVTPATSSSDFPKPSGSLYHANATKTWTDSGTLGYTIRQFTNSFPVTKGDYLAIVLTASNASTYLQRVTTFTQFETPVNGFPFVLKKDTTTWARLEYGHVADSLQYETKKGACSEVQHYRDVGIVRFIQGASGSNITEVTLENLGLTGVTIIAYGACWVQPITAIINAVTCCLKMATAASDFDIALYQLTNTEYSWYTGDETDGWGVELNRISLQADMISSDYDSYEYLRLPFPETEVRLGTNYALMIECQQGSPDYVYVKRFDFGESTEYSADARKMSCFGAYDLGRVATGYDYPDFYYYKSIQYDYSPCIIPIFKTIKTRKLY